MTCTLQKWPLFKHRYWKWPNWPKFNKNEDLIEHKTEIMTKMNKNNKNRDQMYI